MLAYLVTEAILDHCAQGSPGEKLKLFSKFTIDDRSLFYSYNSETRQDFFYSTQWKSPNLPQSSEASQEHADLLLWHERKCSPEVCLSVSEKILRCLTEDMMRRLSYKWQAQNLLLHNNNVPTHTSLFLHQFLGKIKKQLSPTSYSTSLAPSYFFLFPKMKIRLKW